MKTTRSMTSLARALPLAVLLAASPVAAQQTYPTPEAAAKALVDAAKAAEPGFVARIFGPEGADLLSTGVPEADRERLDRFNAARRRR